MALNQSLLQELEMESSTDRIIHHRAQLGMYLPLLTIPVPAMYVLTVDEPL